MSDFFNVGEKDEPFSCIAIKSTRLDLDLVGNDLALFSLTKLDVLFVSESYCVILEPDVETCYERPRLDHLLKNVISFRHLFTTPSVDPLPELMMP